MRLLRTSTWLPVLLAVATVGSPPGVVGASPRGPDAVAREYVDRAAKSESRAWDWLQRQGLDPWILAEQLLLDGRVALAQRLPDAGLTSDSEALRRYLQDAGAVAQSSAQALARASALVGADQLEEALEFLPRTCKALTVSAVRQQALRGEVLARLEREADSLESLECAAERASAIGWRRAEMEARTAILARLPEDDLKGRRRVLAALVVVDEDARDLARSAVWCSQLGRIEAELGKARRARGWLLEADGLFEAVEAVGGTTPGVARERARAVVALSDVHHYLGDRAQALRRALEGIERSRKASPLDRVGALLRAAHAYRELARHDDAIEFLEQAVRIHDETGLTGRYKTLGSLARTLVHQGSFDEAEALYAEARVGMPKSDRRNHYNMPLHMAALVLERPPEARSKADLQRSWVELQRVVRELDEEPPDFQVGPVIRASAQALGGHTCNHLADFRRAETWLRDCLASAYTRSTPSLAQYAQVGLAHALRRQGKSGEAMKVLRDALHRLQGELASVTETFAMDRLAHPHTRALITECRAAAIEVGDPKALRWALEATNGVAFLLEARSRRNRNRRGSHVPETSVLRSAVAEAARVYFRAVDDGKRKGIRDARHDLWKRRKALRNVEERADLARTDDEPRAEARAADADAGLAAHEGILFFVSSEGRQRAVLRHRERYHLFDLGAQSDIDGLVKRAHASWEDRRPDAMEASTQVAHAMLPRRLVDRFCKGCKSAGTGPGHLYVSAAGGAARLPWPFLVELAFGAAPVPTVSRVASESVLAHLQEWTSAQRGGPILALGDPDYTVPATRTRAAYVGSGLARLEHSGDEVRAIATDRRDRMLLGAEADERRLHDHLFNGAYPFDILHLACHGLLFRKTPWLSALAIHPTRDDDGLVTVDEVRRWEFDRGPHLVVLSACQTGLGAPVPGEGEEGLVRAFHLAGARHVVGSLWKVPDKASSELMIAFHKRLRKDRLSPTQALRAAQQEVRQRHPHPSAWAGWSVWGPRD